MQRTHDVPTTVLMDFCMGIMLIGDKLVSMYIWISFIALQMVNKIVPFISKLRASYRNVVTLIGVLL